MPALGDDVAPLARRPSRRARPVPAAPAPQGPCSLPGVRPERLRPQADHRTAPSLFTLRSGVPRPPGVVGSPAECLAVIAVDTLAVPPPITTPAAARRSRHREQVGGTVRTVLVFELQQPRHADRTVHRQAHRLGPMPGFIVGRMGYRHDELGWPDAPLVQQSAGHLRRVPVACAEPDFIHFAGFFASRTEDDSPLAYRSIHSASPLFVAAVATRPGRRRVVTVRRGGTVLVGVRGP